MDNLECVAILNTDLERCTTIVHNDTVYMVFTGSSSMNAELYSLKHGADAPIRLATIPTSSSKLVTLELAGNYLIMVFTGGTNRRSYTYRWVVD